MRALRAEKQEHDELAGWLSHMRSPPVRRLRCARTPGRSTVSKRSWTSREPTPPSAPASRRCRWSTSMSRRWPLNGLRSTCGSSTAISRTASTPRRSQRERSSTCARMGEASRSIPISWTRRDQHLERGVKTCCPGCATSSCWISSGHMGLSMPARGPGSTSITPRSICLVATCRNRIVAPRLEKLARCRRPGRASVPPSRPHNQPSPGSSWRRPAGRGHVSSAEKVGDARRAPAARA